MLEGKKKLISARIRQARISRMLTEEELGNLIGRKKQSVIAYEIGKEKPTNEEILKISNVLKYPVGFFYKKMPVNNCSRSAIFFR